MKIVGIVCEYNPFHNGHKRQIDILRESGAEVIVCAMSGNYTQRGELAIADKYTRAEAAVRCGADLVVELPFPYSSLSAEGFCSAGVHILSSLGCDTLSFGSESADTALLTRAAEIINTNEFISGYTATQKNTGTAKAFFDLLSKHLGEDAALLSNDILGISYISAIQKSKAKMEIFPIQRDGMAYNATELTDSNPSATALRKSAKDLENGFFNIDEKHIPKPSLDTLTNAQRRSHAPIYTDNIGSDILGFFKLMSAEEIIGRAIRKSNGGDHIAFDGCGIVERLCNSAVNSSTYFEFLDRAYNARYTDARINRVILFSLLGVSNVFEKKIPEYTTLLAAGERGRQYLSKHRKTVSIPIITKPADIPQGEETSILQLSDLLYASAMHQKSDFFFKKHPYLGGQL